MSCNTPNNKSTPKYSQHHADKGCTLFIVNSGITQHQFFTFSYVTTLTLWYSNWFVTPKSTCCLCGRLVPQWLMLYNSDDWCWLVMMTDSDSYDTMTHEPLTKWFKLFVYKLDCFTKLSLRLLLRFDLVSNLSKLWFHHSKEKSFLRSLLFTHTLSTQNPWTPLCFITDTRISITLSLTPHSLDDQHQCHWPTDSLVEL